MKKIFFLLYLVSMIGFSQEKTVQKPKIGLVLSGGGAKGFAHIGVLKVLEEAGVKIDYIGGTSMGSVIGGLYAVGYNAHQIDSILKKTDFDELISDYIPRSSKNFFEKRNEEMYALSLPFNKFKIGAPEAFSKGLYNFNMLSRLTKGVREIRDFSKLPIPFVCVGTNIETGEAVLLNKGNLAEAISASSAFPSLFSPVEIDGKLLTDGGVSNNYPIEAVRAMGADIIIGVDVQDDLQQRENLRDATKILVQISNFQTIAKMKNVAGKTDIYIKPDIRDYGVISFNKSTEIVRKGEEATFAVYEKLKLLVDENNPYKKPKLKLPSDSLTIKDVSYKDLSSYNKDYLLGKLRFKPGQKIGFNQLITGVNNLSATQNFSSVKYDLFPTNQSDDLFLDLAENPNKTYLKFALHFDGLYKSAVLVNLTNKKAFFKNDVVSLDLILGDNFRYNLDYYIDNGYNLSFGLKSQFNQFNRNVTRSIAISGNGEEHFGDNSVMNMDMSDLVNQIYFQSIFVQKYLLGAGVEHKLFKISSDTRTDKSPIIENSNYLGGFAYLKYDSYDHKFFPHRGMLFAADVHSYFASSDYTKTFTPFTVLKADLGIANSLFKKTTMKTEIEGGITFGKNNMPFFNFLFGGYGHYLYGNMKNLYGYDFLSISGDSFLKGTLTFDYEWINKHHINVSANYAFIGDDLLKNFGISPLSYTGYALGYTLDTAIGLVEVKHSWSPENSSSYTWFTLGFKF